MMLRRLTIPLLLWILLVGPGLAFDTPLSGAVSSASSSGMTAVSIDLDVAGPGGRVVLERPGPEIAPLLPASVDRLRWTDPRAASLKARLALGAAPAPSLHTRLCVFLC